MENFDTGLRSRIQRSPPTQQIETSHGELRLWIRGESCVGSVETTLYTGTLPSHPYNYFYFYR